MSSFLDDYLRQLTKMGAFPDKLVINTLTMLAHDVLGNLVEGVTPKDLANLIQKRLLRAEPNCKVPILFLIDSIFHNVNGGYIALFSGNLPSIFHDTYREVNQKDRQRMDRLLKNWERRQGKPDQIDPGILADIRARLSPQWSANSAPARRPPQTQVQPQMTYNSMQYVNQQPVVQQYQQPFQQQQQYQAPSAVQAPVPQVAPPQILPPQNGLSYEDTEYSMLLQQTAESLLKDLQNQMVPPIPLEQQYRLDQVQVERQDLYLELFQKARESLAEKGVVCWKVTHLKKPTFVVSVVAKLLKLGSSNGSITDAESKLSFSTEAHLQSYLEAQANGAKKPKTFTQLRARNWFLHAKNWAQGAEQVETVARSFTINEALLQEESTDLGSPVTRKPSKSVVIADDSQKSCPLCGEEFEKVWNDEISEWVYANAVRPDPNGPIYMEKAYLKRSNSIGDLQLPATKKSKLV